MATTATAKGREILKRKQEYPPFNPLDYEVSLARNLSFYSITIDNNKKKKEWALDYWTNEGKDVKGISKLSDGFFITAGAVAHMLMERDLPLSSRDMSYLQKKYVELKALVPTQEPEKTTAAILTKEERDEIEYRSHQGEFENGIDMFFAGKEFDVKSYIISNNINGPMSRRLAESIKPTLKEAKLAATGKDEQLTEAYSHLKSRQLKKFIDYLQSMMSACEVASAITKASKKPRAKKVKAPSEVVKDVKYLREDKVSGLTSLHPSVIINAKEVWVYNNKTRRLFKYCALDGMQLSVKGTTIINIDQEKSGGKIIRKPESQLKGIASMTSRPLNKLFSDIRSTMNRATGRLNEESLIVAKY